jgi:prolyl-tRNA editing enzyme YbaK/EbsC (Cys-tRNA(Pro) deacylase)
MSYENAKAHLEKYNLADRIQLFDVSSATVELAAQAVGVEGARIAKTLSFKLENGCILILAAGDARIDNKKYKACFGYKAKMIPGDQVEALIGHDVGGVCPFGVNEGVTIYLDESLKLHDTVYPAAGTDHSAVRLSISDLEQACDYTAWVDVCKLPEN